MKLPFRLPNGQMVGHAILSATFLLLFQTQVNGIEIVAHRGSSDDAPENSVAAAKLAWERHADAVEFDVRLTADGKLAVIHDDRTDRTTGVSGLVADQTLAALEQLDIGSWKDGKFAGERLPTLSEMIASNPSGRYFVELKSGARSIPALRAELDLISSIKPHQIVVISFDRDAVAAAKREWPDRQALWLVRHDKKGEPQRTFDDVLRLARESGADGVNVSRDWHVDETMVKQAANHGLEVWVWTVDDTDLAKSLAAAGVKGITTNRPGHMRRLFPASSQADR